MSSHDAQIPEAPIGVAPQSAFAHPADAPGAVEPPVAENKTQQAAVTPPSPQLKTVNGADNQGYLPRSEMLASRDPQDEASHQQAEPSLPISRPAAMTPVVSDHKTNLPCSASASAVAALSPLQKMTFEARCKQNFAEATRPVSHDLANASQPLHKEEPKPVLQEQPSRENGPSQNSLRDSLSADF